MPTLRKHNIILQSRSIRLRPMTEQDWDILFKWMNDPEVLYYSEGDDVSGYSLEDVQGIFRGVSRKAFNFIIEYDRQAIGECWLQRMNMPRIIERFPTLDCRRIDMSIGEKEYWGKGIGTCLIRLLTDFGFQAEQADAIFAVGVADYNQRSRRVFEKNGYVLFQECPEPEGMKAKTSYDLILTRERYEAEKQGALL